MADKIDDGKKLKLTTDRASKMLELAKEIAFKSVETYTGNFKPEEIAGMVIEAYAVLMKEIIES